MQHNAMLLIFVHTSGGWFRSGTKPNTRTPVPTRVLTFSIHSHTGDLNWVVNYRFGCIVLPGVLIMVTEWSSGGRDACFIRVLKCSFIKRDARLQQHFLQQHMLGKTTLIIYFATAHCITLNASLSQYSTLKTSLSHFCLIIKRR